MGQAISESCAVKSSVKQRSNMRANNSTDRVTTRWSEVQVTSFAYYNVSADILLIVIIIFQIQDEYMDIGNNDVYKN